MARRIEIKPRLHLDDHAAIAHLAPAVSALRTHAARLAPALAGRTVWMINSTAQGGGVAEMLPGMVGHLRELGIDTEWVVIETTDADFFELTKQLHNLIHGAGTPALGDAERALYERVCRENAEMIGKWVKPGDIVVVHDPQPLALGALLRSSHDIRTIWRCHIGLDEHNAATRAAWAFLRPYAVTYDASVFSLDEYVPDFLRQSARIIHPALDPLAAKNIDLSLHKVSGVLHNAGVSAVGPVVTPAYRQPARRIQPDGREGNADTPEDLGLLTRPTVTQISRWDRLKGFLPLLQGFARLKQQKRPADPLHARRVELLRLVLAGPDPGSIADDPEALEVLDELRSAYGRLPAALHRDVAILLLPMEVRTENALIVNALQRVSSVVVQNSIREGFGLTVAEAMWKQVPVMTSARACGPRHQVRDGVEGRLVAEPEDEEEIARTLDAMLADRGGRAIWGRNAQRRAHDEFMLYGQLERWIDALTAVAA